MPRKTKIRHKRSTKTRRDIMQAALACFAEYGFANTTMEDIRKRSGASNGSIYHHFMNKDQLAAAVYLQGLIEYQAELLERLEAQSDPFEGIRSIVDCHLDWVKGHPDWARYLSEMRHAEFMGTTETEIAVQNGQFMRRVIQWLKPHVEAGTIRRLAPDLFLSLIIGPCQEYTRLWLSGQARTEVSAAVEELTRAAWLPVAGR